MMVSKSEIGPISLSDRLEVVDVLRGLAVGGILIGNMQWFSGYGQAPPAIAAHAPIVDQVTHYLVHVFVEGKFYSIFSFLFGFGFALQISRAAERGDTKASIFKRRLLWLFVIGALHATLLWAGDILSVYALMGFVLLLFRNKPDRSLIKWAILLMAVPIATYLLLYWIFAAFAPADIGATIEKAIADSWTRNSAEVGQGSYGSIITGYNLEYLAGRWIGLVAQMRLPKILAMFLLGLYAFRQGYFHDLPAHRTFVMLVLIFGLTLGLIGNLFMASLVSNEAPFPPTPASTLGVVGYAFGVPALALGIIALVAMLWQKAGSGWLLAFVAPVGRMALTNYLMQTVICVVIFYGYGFGQFAKHGAFSATLIALVIFGSQIAISGLWLKYFAYGPMEWIWRQLTYGRRLSLRLATNAH